MRIFVTCDDTIAAIATPDGEGSIGIIRISGNKSLKILESIFIPSLNHCGKLRSHRIIYGKIKEIGNNNIIDEVLLFPMLAPKSYTGEDVVEISCHGGRIVVTRILNLVLSFGARLAEPGEFTKRAFLNNKMDMIQAESVIDIIRSESNACLENAVKSLQGKLSSSFNILYNKLVKVLSILEAIIDFPDEDIPGYSQIPNQLAEILDKTEELISGYIKGSCIKQGLVVTIAGRPNVGKSCIFNSLLAADRAMVSNISGTTRDMLEEKILIKGRLVRLRDTAGINDPRDCLEEEGINRTLKSIEDSDLILLVLDGGEAITRWDKEILKLTADKNRLILINKCDLENILKVEPLKDKLIRLSSKTGLGIIELRDAIGQRLPEIKDILGSNDVVITRLRHKNILLALKNSIAKGLKLFNDGLPNEILAEELNIGLALIGELLGKVYTEDILDNIFNEFCIGK